MNQYRYPWSVKLYVWVVSISSPDVFFTEGYIRLDFTLIFSYGNVETGITCNQELAQIMHT